MRLWLAAVGRLKSGPERELVERYLGRLAERVTVREVESKPALPGLEQRRREGQLLLAALPPAAVVVALDEGGRGFSTTEFANALEAWRVRGIPDLAFVIGGADGLDATVRERAELVLAFGRMTWPHRLARVMLAEQLYRAASLRAGHPYHRE